MVILNKQPEGLKNFVEYVAAVSEMEETRTKLDSEQQVGGQLESQADLIVELRANGVVSGCRGVV